MMYRLLRRRMDPVAELTSRQSASHRFVQLNALRVLDTADIVKKAILRH
jgi:hypothetical protein